MQRNIEVSHRLILSFWVSVARHAQSAQNKKFAYLCNVSRKAWRMKLFFLPADKDESFLQGDSTTGELPGFPKVPKITSLQYL